MRRGTKKSSVYIKYSRLIMGVVDKGMIVGLPERMILGLSKG
jgi:hypothetical protein